MLTLLYIFILFVLSSIVHCILAVPVHELHIFYSLTEWNLLLGLNDLNGQEPPSGESTNTECGFNYQLVAVIY